MKRIVFFFMIAFSLSGYSQRGEVELNEVAAAACGCIRKLDVNLETASKNDSIQSCIMTYNLVSLVKQTMMPVGKDSIKNYIIADQDYAAIQQLLREKCPAMKNLLESDNRKFNFSHSKDEKAMDYYKKGIAFDQEEKYERAIDNYKKAVKTDPNFAFAWDNLGRSYRMLNKYNEAIECYKKSLSIDPKGTVPMQSMAVVQELLKDYKAAAITYENYIKLYPNDPEGPYGVSRMYYMLELYEPAVENMFKAYERYKESQSPYAADAEANLGVYYRRLEEKNKLEIFRTVAKKYNIEIK